MKYCKQCGSTMNSRPFCQNCGMKADQTSPPEKEGEKTSHCNMCGEIVAGTEEHVCQSEGKNSDHDADTPAGQEGPSHSGHTSPPHPPFYCKRCGQTNSPDHICLSGPIQTDILSRSEGKRKPALLVTLCLTLVFLAGCAAGAWYYIQQQSNPEKASAPFIKALKGNDAAALSKLTANADTHVALTVTEAKELTEELKQSPDILNKVYQSLEDQEKQLLKNEKTEPFIIEIQKLKEKKWKIINQYTIVVHPVSFAVSADQDAVLYVDGEKIKTDASGKIAFKNKLPGTFELKAEKSNAFGSFETEKSISVWQSSAENIALPFTQKYITVNVAETGMDLYVNDEIYAADIQEKQVRIGPLPADVELNLLGELHYPWGTVVSDTVSAKADDTVSLHFDEEETSVADDVYQSIVDFNMSYVDAITYLDASYLINVEDPKRTQTVRIIEDLQRRNTYYRGEIVSMIFDASSTYVSSTGGEYTAEVPVQENYSSVWVAAGAEEDPAPVSKTYYFVYQLRYSEENESWYVYRTIEKKQLTIADPVVIQP